MTYNRAKLLITGILCFGLSITGCSNNKTQQKKSDNKSNTTNSKINVICTIFPEYDWARELTKNCSNISINLLMKNGVDLHSFKPSAGDIVNISRCDLFVYVGGESDFWIEDILNNSVQNKVHSLNLMETLKGDTKEEEIVEGMQSEEESNEESDEENDIEDTEVEYDEHVWLSIKMTKKICSALYQSLISIDEEEKDIITENFNSYEEQLNLLDDEYKSAFNSIDDKTIICCDRFPFRYLMDDYNIKYYAAFVGCSAETEASFETIAFLAKKLNETKLPYVLTIEKSNQKIAKTVIANSAIKESGILALDSMQSVTDKELDEGKNYLGVMKENLDVLKKVLGIN